VVTVQAASTVAAEALVVAMAMAGAAVVGAHHTALAEKLVAAVIAEVEAMRTTRSQATHVEATMPTIELKGFVAKRLLKQMTATMLTVNYRIKVHMDLQADKSPVVVKGPFFPRVVNPRYRIRGTMCNARIQSSKARKAIFRRTKLHLIY
jgi:hypothetical protein